MTVLSFLHLRRSSEDEQSITDIETDAVLTGTTLEIYKYLITHDRPLGPRELQRALTLSSPGVASFHLEKLQRNGLITKNESEGSFAINRVYLKHFILLRRHLIPRYFFYAALSTVLAIGWITAIYLGIGSTLTRADLHAVFYVFVYGIITSILVSAIFWYETWQVLKREII
ncbi:MAG: winged helix-turn-helix domain-containing protein [Nitrososphaerales archaeon]